MARFQKRFNTSKMFAFAGDFYGNTTDYFWKRWILDRAISAIDRVSHKRALLNE